MYLYLGTLELPLFEKSYIFNFDHFMTRLGPKGPMAKLPLVDAKCEAAWQSEVQFVQKLRSFSVRQDIHLDSEGCKNGRFCYQMVEAFLEGT